MKIVVAIKRVPDTATRIRIDEGTNAINTRDVKFVMSPYDEIALEQATANDPLEIKINKVVAGQATDLVIVGTRGRTGLFDHGLYHDNINVSRFSQRIASYSVRVVHSQRVREPRFEL